MKEYLCNLPFPSIPDFPNRPWDDDEDDDE